jgi:RNA polymerase sigma-70 factor (ECF subfamily)
MNESEAVARLKHGDIQGLETLVALYQQQALDVAYLISANYALSEDIVQSAFLRVYERIDQFDSLRPFGPWFLRTVVNDTLKALTRRQSLSLDSDDVSIDGLLPPSDDDLCAMVEAAETKEAVWRTLDNLSPGQRAAVVMRYYLDLSDPEISTALRITQGSVRRRLHDARKRLRVLLPSWLARPVED